MRVRVRSFPAPNMWATSERDAHDEQLQPRNRSSI